MSDASRSPLSEIQVDEKNLYREDVITDLRVATIRRLTPIRPDGSVDESRPVLFSGETQLMSQAGIVPVNAPIEALTLQEAIAKFPAAIHDAVERLVEEAREYQRREASRIVLPGQPGSPPMGGLPGLRGKLDLK